MDISELIEWIILLILAILFVSLDAMLIRRILKSPFSYPYKIIRIDISGRRNPKTEDLVDRYIIEHGFEEFNQHMDSVVAWKKKCQRRIEKSPLKKRRTRQYESCLDDENMFVFQLTRVQTRYTQSNYVKSSYQVDTLDRELELNYGELADRYYALENIGFECTVSEYQAKDQRKRMTKALREEIAERDNYTCRICGKYMPDGVGLQIDHIVPIAKGGKTVPSNLQVLCSVCNGRKSSK